MVWWMFVEDTKFNWKHFEAEFVTPYRPRDSRHRKTIVKRVLINVGFDENTAERLSEWKA